jgi:hypothetical protein
MSVATFNKLGTFPPRAFRKVAILLMFTLLSHNFETCFTWNKIQSKTGDFAYFDYFA